MPRSCPIYYETLATYCLATGSIPLIASNHHLLLIKDNIPMICHYTKTDGHYQFDNFKSYDTLDEATQVIYDITSQTLKD